MDSFNLRKYLLIIGIGIIVVGFIIAPYDHFKTSINPKKVSFFSQNDYITITGNLYLPQNYNSSESYPAVILVHGINARAEHYHHFAVEFVRRNFIALAINLRGHQNSGGICSISAYEPWDIMGAADFLLTNYNITNLGVVGHSLGGMSSIRATHNDTRFNATVVMGPPVSIDILLSRIISGFEFFVQYQYLLSFHMNFSDPYERYIRSPVFWINQTSPKNFFYALGSDDIAATVEEALLCIVNATGNSTVEANVAYGNFADGNRTLLKIYPGVNHESEPKTPEIIVDTILWIESAFNITNEDLNPEDLIQWNLNSFWHVFITVGLLICVSPSISYICNSILTPKKIKRPKIGTFLEFKKKILSLGLYTGIFIGASVLTFPIAIALNYTNWNPYNIAGFIANILTIQGIFLLIGVITIIFFEKRYYKATWIDLGLNKTTILRTALIGIIISAFLIFGLFFLPDLNSFQFSYPRDWIAYLMIFFNFFLISIIGEIYFRGLIQTKLYKEKSRIKNWLNILFIALICGLIQGIAIFFMMLPLVNITITLEGFIMNLHLLGFVGGFIVFTILGLLNGWIFLKTQHILSGAIVQASILSWFLVTFMVPL